MTSSTKSLEEKFNQGFPVIKQAEPGKGERRRFNKKSFLKAALELQKVVKENDQRALLQR
jgi:hypothetical protein